jgi:hypothetical protein
MSTFACLQHSYALNCCKNLACLLYLLLIFWKVHMEVTWILERQLVFLRWVWKLCQLWCTTYVYEMDWEKMSNVLYGTWWFDLLSSLLKLFQKYVLKNVFAKPTLPWLLKWTVVDWVLNESGLLLTSLAGYDLLCCRRRSPEDELCLSRAPVSISLPSWA